MAFCPSRGDQAGYATPAALVFSVGLTLVATAMVGRSVELLRLSREDLKLMQTEYLLAGIHLSAAAAIVRTNRPPPYEWQIATEMGWVRIRAEPERQKLTLAAAAALSDEMLDAFEISNTPDLRRKLLAAAGATARVNLAELDGSPVWRHCAASLISPYGAQEGLVYAAPSEPVVAPNQAPPSWRIGEMWRLVTTTTTGWRDERIVRFTGDAGHPVAVVFRRLWRTKGEGGRCEGLARAVIIDATAGTP